MFALLLSDKMDPFYQNIGSFPTLIFSFMLGACLIYWLFAVVGVVDLSFLDITPEITNADLSVGPVTSGDAGSGAVTTVMSGLFVRFGLFGVPTIIILSFISLFGWFISFVIVHLFFDPLWDSILRYPIGLVVVLFSAYCSAWITAYAIRPIRKIFKRSLGTSSEQLIGKVVFVRTSRVDDSFGEATLDDGGAGLILQVRSADQHTLSQGEPAVILEYEPEHHCYRIISEARFDAGED